MVCIIITVIVAAVVVAILVVPVVATTAAVKNVAGGRFSKTKIVATNAINVVIAATN